MIKLYHYNWTETKNNIVIIWNDTNLSLYNKTNETTN